MPKNPFNQMRKAIKKQFSVSKSQVGKNRDEELGVYSKLTSEDFDRIAEMYGPQELVRYVKVMEEKKNKTQ
jgi:hypothetical protein